MHVLNEEFLGRLDDKTRKHVRYFIDGRPIFGEKFGDTDAFYGYLNLSEASNLKDALIPFDPNSALNSSDEDFAALQDAPYAEFVTPLVELLTEVVAKGQGLAIYIG